MAAQEIPTKTLPVDAIKDFQVCERFYSYKYEEKEPEAIYARELQSIRFENTLKKVATFFFYKKQADIIPSYTALLNRWEKLWFPKDMTAYDLAVEQLDAGHGNLASYSNAAAAALERFHRLFANDTDIPIMIDEPFLLPLKSSPEQMVRLEGKIDLVLRDKNRNFKLIKWVYRRRKNGLNSVLLDFAALKLAFENSQQRSRSVTYGVYDLSSAHGEFQPIEVRQGDIDALYYWASSIGDSQVYAPRRGFTAYCKGCPFDEQCSEWDGWNGK